jgi:hypothetical protein
LWQSVVSAAGAGPDLSAAVSMWEISTGGREGAIWPCCKGWEDVHLVDGMWR